MAFEITLTRQQTKQAHKEWLQANKDGGMMLAQVHTQCLGCETKQGMVRVNILSAEEARAVNTLLTGIRSQKSAFANIRHEPRPTE